MCRMTEGDHIVGEQKVHMARLQMPGIPNLEQEYSKQRPLEGISFLGCVTPTPQTGVLILTLIALGAKVSWCSDNRFASDDDVVAYLIKCGVRIFAHSNMTEEEYFARMEDAINEVKSDDVIHIIDDGCDITQYLATTYPDLLNRVRALTEQTACGINFLTALYAANKISIPSFNIDGCFFKKWFDNYYGIQESIIHSFAQMGLMIHGKTCAILGYGAIGGGTAKALHSMGAKVMVVECDILKATQAKWDGFIVSSVAQALEMSDICLTASGCFDTISGTLIEQHARPGIYLGNIGHGTKEYDVAFLERKGTCDVINAYIRRYTLPSGKHVYSLCEGALVNFIAGGGNPSSVMSHTFTLTLLAHIEMTSRANTYPKNCISTVPRRIEEHAAALNYPDLVSTKYPLTKNQKSYLNQCVDAKEG
jgi:adenosylhomocysteinase